ncbi:MAG TPA: OB-fold domain-containing protein [Bryobacteraceae bacterium]|nr:OB-fold domain-containing protein [Bryobacteraceae bacterium]
MRTGTVYTETVIYSAAEAFAAEAPFQTAIVALDGASEPSRRLTVRIAGGRVSIGDRVVEVDSRGGVPFFQKVPLSADDVPRPEKSPG